MKQLNDVIGALRAEKLQLTTQLRKHQLRITHLNSLVDQLSKQVHIICLYKLSTCAEAVPAEIHI